MQRQRGVPVVHTGGANGGNQQLLAPSCSQLRQRGAHPLAAQRPALPRTGQRQQTVRRAFAQSMERFLGRQRPGNLGPEDARGPLQHRGAACFEGFFGHSKLFNGIHQ